MSDTLAITKILSNDRLRRDMGDIDGLSNSIKEYGLIQPIVLGIDLIDDCDESGHVVNTKETVVLIAGGRRLAAVKRLGWKDLLHGRDFIWRSELVTEKGEIKLRRQAVELEENLKRQDLSWQEQVEGKKRLLLLMQSIYGPAKLGAPTRSERSGNSPSGFGVNKLAAMLGESKALTSKDLELADMIEKMPGLKKADTKESARRQVSIMGAVASMKSTAKQAALLPGAASRIVNWTLYEGDFDENASLVPDGLADLVYTDLPFGVSLSSMSKHSKGVVSYSDSRESVVSMLGMVASESYRMLANDRFAVFWFGFNYYGELLEALKNVGFNVNPVPVVWYKHTRSTENPNTRYGNAYDPAIVAMKGSPVFIRPGQTNVFDIAAVLPSAKLQIAQQPVGLVERFIEDMTVKDALIVDLCAGSGTTGEAAIRTKRRVVLFEREPQACSLIKARLGAL